MSLDQIRSLGYSVEPAVVGYKIRGFGLNTQIREDDLEAVNSITDLANHNSRKLFYEYPDVVQIIEDMSRAGYNIELTSTTDYLFSISGPQTNLVNQTLDDVRNFSSTATNYRLVTEMRGKRDQWLGLTDFIGAYINGYDVGLPQNIKDDITANQQAWLDFRQAVRDVPDNYPTGVDVVWPVPPAAPVVVLP